MGGVAPKYIVVEKWDEKQHYKHQDRPAWIKLYTKLLHNHAFMALPEGARCVLFHLWLEYASSGRRLVLDTASLSRRFNMRVTSTQLKRLEQAGFITICSRRTLEKLYAREEESREEKDKGLTEASYEGNGLSQFPVPASAVSH